MSKKESGFVAKFYGNIMPKIYGLGAAVVIIGAMFKLNGYAGATEMLFIGLSVEALIFAFSAFEPAHKDPDWSKVYPELAEDAAPKPVAVKGQGTPSQQLDNALEKAKIGPELFENLGKGMKNLAENASKMSNISDAAAASNEYANNARKASETLGNMNKSYASTAAALTEMNNAAKGAGEYQAQIQKVTTNLGALNKVYEMELQDANSHVKALNKFYSNITGAMEGLGDASKEAEQFKAQMNKFVEYCGKLMKAKGDVARWQNLQKNLPSAQEILHRDWLAQKLEIG